jgi:hypothetical protein
MPKKVKKIIYTVIIFTLGFILAVTLTTNAAENLASSSVGYDNSISGSSKTTVKEALDELYEKASNIKFNLKCKRATILHLESCTNSDTSAFCQADGYAIGDTVTYGSLGTSGTLTSGDAFDCDVNGDGIYNASTERFYYVTDLSSNSNYAVLIYYNNVSSGKPSNTIAYPYDKSNVNNNGPVTAITQLPTTDQWSNVSLSNTKRAIITQTGTTSTSAGTLSDSFSYTGYSARLLTTQEINTGCSITVGNKTIGELSSKCQYLMENTKYTNSSYIYGYWLEIPYATSSNIAWIVNVQNRSVRYNEVYRTDNIGVRPVIEVLKSDIEY